jgi:hypothetical protein
MPEVVSGLGCDTEEMGQIPDGEESIRLLK